MFCRKCGAELAEGAAFCRKCGHPVRPAEIEAPVKETESNINNTAPEKKPVKERSGKKNRKFFLMIGIAVAAAAAVFLILSLFILPEINRIPIDMDEVRSVSFSGYNGYGEVSVNYFGLTAYGDELMEKLRDQSSGLKGPDAVLKLQEQLNSSKILGNDEELENEDVLKNGDVVSFDSGDKKAVEKRFNVRLENWDREITVAELKEPDIMDPFENVYLRFYGEDGNGTLGEPVILDILRLAKRFRITFNASEVSSLSNEDEITLTVAEDEQYQELLKSGVVLEPMTKTYLVEGLSEEGAGTGKDVGAEGAGQQSGNESASAFGEASEGQQDADRKESEDAGSTAAEASLEEYFSGIWQGNDSYRTTIIIYPDHSLYYCELGSDKADNVRGYWGMWTASDRAVIEMQIAGLGDGYELIGIRTHSSGYLLRCTNNKPWNDEIIERSDLTEEEVDSMISAALKLMGY